MKPAKPFFRRNPCETIGYLDEGAQLEPFATDEPGSVEDNDGKRLRVVILSKGDFDRLVKRARVTFAYSERSIDRDTVRRTNRRVASIRQQLFPAREETP